MVRPVAFPEDRFEIVHPFIGIAVRLSESVTSHLNRQR
jgi:hypothetical protein